ncbi:MAG: hypothetical protein LUG21_04425 [Clostridiales bacterium]|nr:hypothetical protein [Clostridiales bacterium]
MSSEDKKQKKRGKFSLRKLVYNDKYLIIMSVIAALVIWVTTSINLSPETTKKITVPVSVDFSGTLAEQLGIQYYDSKDITVEVTISCKKYIAREIKENDINAYLRTNSVTSTGYHSVPIIVQAVDGAEFTIKSYSPTTAEGFYDVADSVEMPVQLNFSNKDFTADGYVSGTPTLSVEQVTVNGPKTYVSQVSKVSASVDLQSGLTESQLVDLTPVALDANGNKVDYVTIDTAVSANIPILKVETIKPKVNFINAPADAQSLFDISYSVSSVQAGVLETAGITDLTLGDINFADVSPGENKFTFDVTNLNGILVLDGTTEVTVTINVPDDYETKTFSVSRGDIVLNTPDGYTANILSLSSYEITVAGSSDTINNISKSNIVLSCDLNPESGKTVSTGTNTYAVNISVKDYSDAWVIGTYTAEISVKNAK